MAEGSVLARDSIINRDGMPRLIGVIDEPKAHAFATAVRSLRLEAPGRPLEICWDQVDCIDLPALTVLGGLCAAASSDDAPLAFRGAPEMLKGWLLMSR